MGSKFVDLYLADPEELKKLVRGDHPERLRALAESLEGREEALRPALEVMARGTLCFLPKGEEHPEGILYCRAFERLMVSLGAKRWGIELYPDESASLAWDLCFGHCEADWLDLPHPESGIGVTAWRAPRTCYSLANQAGGLRSRGDYDPRFLSEGTLKEIEEAGMEGYRSGKGLFTVYQA